MKIVDIGFFINFYLSDHVTSGLPWLKPNLVAMVKSQPGFVRGDCFVSFMKNSRLWPISTV